METRVADFIIQYIFNRGTDTIFTIAGGGAMFLNDAVAVHKRIRYVCNHHEQASAMAAEAYAKLKNQIGAVMVTSGPGSTNAITGIMEAYQNSIPVLVISSQTKKSQMIANSGCRNLRQFGTQEVDIIPIVAPLTKYAAIVEKPEDIRYHMDKAYHLATTNRPGPVWLDIPSDVAATQIPTKLRPFYKPKLTLPAPTDTDIQTVVNHIHWSKKPLIIAGGGIKSAKAKRLFTDFILKAKIPVVAPDMGIDILEYDNPYYIGHGGTKGDRAANIAIQKSDLIISLGSRLSVPFIGHEYHTWAPYAYKIVVDIDEVEHQKKTISIDCFIKSDVNSFLHALIPSLDEQPEKQNWINFCRLMKTEYALKSATVSTDHTDKINMYDAAMEISKQSKPGDVFITDAGTTAYVVTQSVRIKKNQRMIIPGATLTMGYNLPATIGVWAADPERRIICITGDGSFQMNIHELATIAHHNIPVKLFIMNNQGYLAIRTTQKNFFSNRLIGEGKKSGVTFPDLRKIAQAYQVPYYCAKTKRGLANMIQSTLNSNGPAICEIMLPYWQDIITVSSKKLPNGNMVSFPIDEMAPFLPAADLHAIRGEIR